MSNARQVMQIALDALEYVVDQGGGPVCEHQAGGAVCFCKENEAINALRKELAAHPQPTEPAPSTAGERVKIIADALEHADSLRVVMQDQAAETIESLCALLSAPALPAAAMPVGELTTFEDWAKAKGLDKDLNFTPTRLPPPARHYMHIQTNQLLMAWNAGLAAARSQPVREPLTDEELDLICEKALFCRISFQQFARSIEAAHGITKKGADQPER